MTVNQDTITSTSGVDNGVNVEALLGAREAFADAPEIARFQWRSTVSWVNGTHSRPTVETFYGFGEEQRHSQERSASTSTTRCSSLRRTTGSRRSEVRAGRARRLPDRGHRGRRAAAGHPAAVRAGRRSAARWTCTASSAPTRTSATASAGCGSTTASTPTRPPAEIEALVAQSQKRSAVYDILTNPTAVTVTVS